MRKEQTDAALVEPITHSQAVMYEISSSWWACWIWNATLQDWAAKYFVWKARRKLARAKRFYELDAILSQE